MYQYPNGLLCDASKARVRAYEAIVPLVATAAALLGSIQIVVKFYDPADVLWSAAVTPWMCLAWVVVCAAVAYGIFHVWCNPIKQG